MMYGKRVHQCREFQHIFNLSLSLESVTPCAEDEILLCSRTKHGVP